MTTAGEWGLIQLDEKLAKRAGMPPRLPVPKGKMEELGDQGMSHQVARQWIQEFLGVMGPSLEKQDPQLAQRYRAYLAKSNHWQKAEAAFAQQDFATAIRLLRTITQLDPDDYAARQSLATAYLAAQDTDAALKLFANMVEVWSGVADFHVAYAQAHLSAGAREAALEQFVLALEAQPDCRPAMEGLATLDVLVRFYEDPLDLATLIYVRKDSLVEYLEGSWDAQDLSPEAYLLRVTDHESEGRYAAMRAAAERAVRVAPDNMEGHLARARACRLAGDLEQAKAFIESSQQQYPESAQLCAELAKCARAAADHEAEEAALARALELDPGEVTALGMRFLSVADTDLEGVRAQLPPLEEHVAKHPNAAGAWRVLARVHARVGSEDPSIEAYARALELAPEDDDLRGEYWTALIHWGRFDTVLAEAEKIEQITNRDWKLRWAEAEAMQGLGRRMEARGAFMGINGDRSLHIAIRARAKRAVEALN